MKPAEFYPRNRTLHPPAFDLGCKTSVARSPHLPLLSIQQTARPHVHIDLAPGAAGFKIFDPELGQTIAPEGVPGERIRVEGLVLDSLGAPVRDVLLEVWQADANGIYPHPKDPRVTDATQTAPATYRFDSRLQGDGETVFIDV